MLDHVNHEEDLVPAPAGGCPSTVVTAEPDPETTATPQYAGLGRGAGLTASMPGQTATALRSLPMTGAGVWPVALIGLGFLLTGAGLRLRDPLPRRSGR